MMSTRKNIVRLAVGLLILSIPVAASYFGGANSGGAAIQIPSASTEVGYFSYSPKGAGGGITIPASCELNYAHYAGECSGTGCVSDGSCNAPTPSCDQTTYGTDNCGNACSKTGSPCGVTYVECDGGCGQGDCRPDEWARVLRENSCSGFYIRTVSCTYDSRCVSAPRYSCSGGACVSDPSGPYTDPSCNNACGGGLPDLIPKDLNITF